MSTFIVITHTPPHITPGVIAILSSLAGSSAQAALRTESLLAHRGIHGVGVLALHVGRRWPSRPVALAWGVGRKSLEAALVAAPRGSLSVMKAWVVRDQGMNTEDTQLRRHQCSRG
jgi:hypothetical protein